MGSRRSVLLDRKYKEFFIPTILMAMTTTMSVVVDSIIVGNMLGTDALAAVNLVMPLMMVYTSLAVSLGLGAATVISVAKGRRQHEYANKIFTVTVSAILVITVLLSAGQLLFFDHLSTLLTNEQTLLPLVKSYVHVLIFGTPVIVMTLAMTYCLRVEARVKLASAILITANVVNLLLDLLYMGPMQLGIAGSSLATVSGYLTGALLLLTYVFSKQRTLRFDTAILSRPKEIIISLWEVLTTGSPAAMGSILISLKILCINTLVLSVAGKSGMVAFSVCLSCLSLVSMFISGAAQAMTPIVGVLFGEGDYTGVRMVVKRALQVLLLSSMGIVIGLELKPELVLQAFGVHAADDIAVGIPAIRIFAVSLLGTSVSFLAMFYYMTVGKRVLSNAIAVVQGFVAVVPVAYGLSYFLGISGVWLAFSVAELVTAVMIYCYFKRQQRLHPEAIQDILLLDYRKSPQNQLLEVTISQNPHDVEKALTGISEYLEMVSANSALQQSVRDAVTEVVKNIVQHGYTDSQDEYIDIRLSLGAETVTVAIRDSGIEFNPNVFLEQHAANAANAREGAAVTAPQKQGGLSMVKAIATSLIYSRAIGFNNNILVFKLHSLQEPDFPQTAGA